MPRTLADKVRSENWPSWFIYKCSDCGATWNIDIAVRVNPQDIPPSHRQAMEVNDPGLAWYYAFDVPTLRRSGAQIQYPTDFQVLGPAIDWDGAARMMIIEPEPPRSV